MKDRISASPSAVFAKAAGGAAGGARRKVLEVDVARFQHALDSADMTDDEKAKYLQLVWSIVLQFVDLGYGIHPVQQNCGQFGQTDADDVPAVPDAVECAEPSNKRPTPSAAPKRVAERETS
ncbi:MAG: hypothetical protein AAF683_01450 [Pseudomonadota bacterium]